MEISICEMLETLARPDDSDLDKCGACGGRGRVCYPPAPGGSVPCPWCEDGNWGEGR